MFGKPFFAVLALMIACGVAVSRGKPDPDVSFNSARQLWSDVLRDADDLGLQLTRVSAGREMQLGDQLAAEVARWNTEDPAASARVAAVGERLLPGVNRKAIRYHFHVLNSPGINAFALPGGHVYVLSGMLDFVQSDSELAATLGHEISHVDLRHCIERYQYQLALKKVGADDASAIAGLAHMLIAIGYNQDEELEADLSGQRLAVKAGYDPYGAVRVFERLAVKLAQPPPVEANTPGSELSQAIEGAFGSYFRTHPLTAERELRLRAMAERDRRALGGR